MERIAAENQVRDEFARLTTDEIPTQPVWSCTTHREYGFSTAIGTFNEGDAEGMWMQCGVEGNGTTVWVPAADAIRLANMIHAQLGAKH
jgi:hypothetical protein